MRNKASRGANIFMFIFFFLLAVLGFVAVTFGKEPISAWLVENGITNKAGAEEGNALASLIAYLPFCLIPCIGPYLAFRAPYSFGKGTKAVMIIVSLVGMALMGYLYFGLITKAADFIEEEDLLLFGASLFFSYAMTWVNYGIMAIPASRNMRATSSSDGALNKAFDVASRIINGILSFKDSHTDAYIVISTILTTVLGVVTFGFILLLISLIISIVMFVVIGGIILFMLMNSHDPSTEKLYVVYDGWNKRTLKYYGGHCVGGGDRYIDDIGQYWITEDNGNTFYKEYESY